jgi:molybdopterin molybdotransferase
MPRDEAEPQRMIDYAQALQCLRLHVTPLAAEGCLLADAAGRVLASAVRSPIALPTFDHAAMDGYALAANEPLLARSEHAVSGSRAAGDGECAGRVECCEIMTGAQLPAGLNAVVAVENTQMLEARADGTPACIRLLQTLAAGQNVRYAGSDVAAGAEVLSAGTRLDSAGVMLLAALGIGRIDVVRRPRVAIICTGRELQADSAQPLATGRIHNSNGPYRVAALRAAGAHVPLCETVDDTSVTYVDALRQAVDAGVDLVISTGAVSMGRYDFVPATLARLGAQQLFHGVAMRPGKPLLCARLAAGPLILAMPGTPMAVAAAMRFFVSPVLHAMAGQAAEPPLHAVLDTPQQPKSGLRHFLRATLYLDRDSRLHARVLAQQQPFRIQPFAEAGAWVVLSEDAGDCARGSKVEVVSLLHDRPPRIDQPSS